MQCSLSQCGLELASVKSIIWTCVPQKVRRELLYTWSLSLSWQLQTWTRGSHPVVHVPSSWASLTWALLLTHFWLSYLCMVLPSASLTWECDLYWNWRVRVPSYTFLVVSPAAFIICTTLISGDVLALAISNHLVAWVYIWRLHL